MPCLVWMNNEETIVLVSEDDPEAFLARVRELNAQDAQLVNAGMMSFPTDRYCAMFMIPEVVELPVLPAAPKQEVVSEFSFV